MIVTQVDYLSAWQEIKMDRQVLWMFVLFHNNGKNIVDNLRGYIVRKRLKKRHR